MGFWHTGYIDFHQPSGLDPPFVPLPLTYQCSICQGVFSTLELYEKHRFEAHPRTRPLLLVRGMEVGDSEFVLTTPLSATDIAVVGACKATLNGFDIVPEGLGRALEQLSHGSAHIQLENEGLRSSFRLRIEVARRKRT